MKRLALLAAAAALAAPAVFAQSAATVTSGGTVILEGPAQTKPLRGAVIAEAPVLMSSGTVATAPAVIVQPSTNVLGGPAVVVSETASAPVVMHYWNVPSNISHRADFQRYRRLIP
jgi:hypothetical protein